MRGSCKVQTYNWLVEVDGVTHGSFVARGTSSDKVDPEQSHIGQTLGHCYARFSSSIAAASIALANQQSRKFDSAKAAPLPGVFSTKS
jgi:hypothetical protein